jgi:WS/DGAT/MGAT family acyltransferase
VSAPVWVDDADFDIVRHTRHVRLPAPGGPAELESFMADLLSAPMDLAHPLWDIHTIENIEPDVIAVVVRAHHVMADGLALYDAATLLLDATPQPFARAPHGRLPEPAVSRLHLSAISLADRARRQANLAAEVWRALFDPRRLVSNARLAGQVVGGVRNTRLPKARSLPFTRPVGRRRAFAWGALPIGDVMMVKDACGVTVNDVVLAITAGALRRQLESIGSLDPGGPDPRAIIPIGARNRAELALGNRFSVTSVELPVAVEDPLERVGLIHSRMHRRPTSQVQSFMPRLFSIADVLPPPALRALIPPVLARQPLVDLAVSNIPGSRNPLYLCDSRLLGLYPFITGVGNIALIVGVLSYVDELGVGITVDPDIVGDPQLILGHMHAAATELTDLIR